MSAVCAVPRSCADLPMAVVDAKVDVPSGGADEPDAEAPPAAVPVSAPFGSLAAVVNSGTASAVTDSTAPSFCPSSSLDVLHPHAQTISSTVSGASPAPMSARGQVQSPTTTSTGLPSSNPTQKAAVISKQAVSGLTSPLLSTYTSSRSPIVRRSAPVYSKSDSDEGVKHTTCYATCDGMRYYSSPEKLPVAQAVHHHRFLDQPFPFYTADGHPTYGVMQVPRYAPADPTSLYQGNLQHGMSVGVIPDRFQFIVGDFMCDTKSTGSTVGDSQAKDTPSASPNTQSAHSDLGSNFPGTPVPDTSSRTQLAETPDKVDPGASRTTERSAKRRVSSRKASKCCF